MEPGWTCAGGTTALPDTCTEACGNSRNYHLAATACDDGGTTAGDGCNAACTIETYWTCSGGTASSKDTCAAICGDGRRLGTEGCDDGNTNDYDGYSFST